MRRIAIVLKAAGSGSLKGAAFGAATGSAIGGGAMLFAVVQAGGPWDYYGMALGVLFGALVGLGSGAIIGVVGGCIGGAAGAAWGWGIGGLIGGAALGVFARSWFPPPLVPAAALLGGVVGTAVGCRVCRRHKLKLIPMP